MGSTGNEIRTLLGGGTRQSLGRSGELTEWISSDPARFGTLIRFLWDADPIVRMRAADVAEKVSRENTGLLQPFKGELLGLLAETVQQELRWHLALMVPRLRLTATERRRAAGILEEYLKDSGSIVKTHAMQGLADLARVDARLRLAIVEKLRILTLTGTPAMRARGRKLLGKEI